MWAVVSRVRRGSSVPASTSVPITMALSWASVMVAGISPRATTTAVVTIAAIVELATCCQKTPLVSTSA